MTREEHISNLETIGCDGWTVTTDAYKSLQFAIKALEQEPYEDAVSRKAVHDMLENLPVTVENKWFNWLQKACLRLAELPSIQPKPMTRELTE